MILKLMDYRGKIIEHDIGEKDSIARIDIEILSGDEVATVLYKDYSIANFDSSHTRITGYCDGGYALYDYRKENNLIDNDKWKNRSTTYWYDDYDEES